MKRTNPLPDKRLLERGEVLKSRLVENRSCVIRQLSRSWKEEMGFWRYLKNKKVSVQWQIEQSLAAMKSHQDFVGRHILSIQDSSTIGFKVATGLKKGLDSVGSVGSCPGFIVHPNLLIDADDGRCLGLGDLAIFDEWVAKGDKYSQKQVSAEEKKSVRWLDSGKAIRPLLQSAETITHIADRESDFYEMLLEFGQNRQENEHLLVRVSEDRLLGHMEGRGKAKYGFKPDEKVMTGKDIETTFPYRTKLSKLVEKLPIQAQWTLNLPSNPKRAARKAEVALRYATKVPLRRPVNLYKRTYQGKPLPFYIYMNVVDLVEICPSDALYEPIMSRFIGEFIPLTPLKI